MAVSRGKSGQQEDEHRNARSHNPPNMNITGVQRQAFLGFSAFIQIVMHNGFDSLNNCRRYYLNR